MDYSATVRENVLFGVDAATGDPDIWKYLETFGIAGKIRAHKLGLDAILGDDIEFSGGEKQILAFIRILLQDRPVVILDEGTNQLDAENELLVMSELLKRKDEKIIIFITHRMSTVSRADSIHCIENGTVSASGTHSALLKDGKNPYARFYRAQILHREEGDSDGSR
jgi:ATP-binding cassette subfamily B protein